MDETASGIAYQDAPVRRVGRLEFDPVTVRDERQPRPCFAGDAGIFDIGRHNCLMNVHAVTSQSRFVNPTHLGCEDNIAQQKRIVNPILKNNFNFMG